MNIALLPSDERTLVNVRVTFDVRIVRELELIPLGVVERHCVFARIDVGQREQMLVKGNTGFGNTGSNWESTNVLEEQQR